MSNEIDNGAPRSSHLPPNPTCLSPTWCPPKSPLPPYRLAKLANALGVPTPIPANHNSSSLSRSFSESAGSNDPFRRSPTPSSVASAMGFHPYQPTSKFLLHVIPPHHLPHDSNDSDVDHTSPPPPNAPGYHVHFRRGTLIPVYPTLQAQLGAIAKEYALPSTTGLILYIVSTPATDASSQTPDEIDEPGPRLSEDIWKHLWTRVLRIEQRDDLLMPTPAPSPNFTPQLLGLGSGTRSTPSLPQESSGLLRPFIASPGPQPHAPQPRYTSPSTSSLSDIRLMNKSAPPSSESISPSEPDTPDTSVDEFAARANSIDLPGLTSPSLIPILAKVEFDIDRRKAGWYSPWLRSRNVNHAKRTDNRKCSKTNADHEPSDHVPIELLTGKKEKLKRLSRPSVQDEILEAGGKIAGYAPLSESPGEIDSDTESIDDEDYCEDATARVSSSTGGKDPLDDVFGTDADTWADIHASNEGDSSAKNPHIVQLALTGAELVALPSQEGFDDDDDISTKEEDDVRELLDLMSKPNLAISIPSPPKNKRASSPIGINGTRKNIPSPLIFVPKDKSGGSDVSATPSLSPPVPLSSSPAEEDNDSAEENFDQFTRLRSPEESEKRGGAVFDDLDLGLDPTEDFDDSDPNDRRRSQFLMMAQLDELERTMAHLSPRMLNMEIEDEQNSRFNSATLSPKLPGQSSLSPGRSSGHPSPSRLPPNPPEPPESPIDFTGQSWPAVPFASIRDNSTGSEEKRDRPPSPPCLAVNGVTTSAPRSYMQAGRPGIDPRSETERRKKELEDEQALYLPVPPPKDDKDLLPPSPIPLPSDPFGRYPSVESSTSVPVGTHWTPNTAIQSVSTRQEVASEVPQAESQSQSLPTTSSTTSRFSADSVTGEELASIVKTSNRTTLISVKSFKKLWRRSDSKKSISSISSVLPATTSSSGRTSPMVPPPRPERPSEDQLYLPDVPGLPPTHLSPQLLSSQPPPREHPSRRPSQDQHITLPPSRSSLALDQVNSPIPLVHSNQLSVPSHPGVNHNSPTTTTYPQHISKASNLDRLYFDQESPYPVRCSPPVRQASRPPSPPPLPAIPKQEKPARKSILKWKSSTNHTTNPSIGHTSESQPRSSLERPGPVVNSRGRRPSVINFGSTRASVTSPDLLPPSPQIPEHFVNKKGLEHQQSQRSRFAVSPAELNPPPPRQSSQGALSSSPPRSMASSHSSQERQPSFDASQFEIVSPKSGGSLSYPYHTLDQ